MSLDDGRVLVGPVTFKPPAGLELGDLTAAAQKKLGLTADLRQAFEDGMRRLDTLEGVDNAAGWVDALTVGRKPGRGNHQDAHVYITWAERRVEAEREAPERPIKWLVEKYGDRGYSESSINAYVGAARDKGFLSPVGEPVELTPLTKRLLKRSV